MHGAALAPDRRANRADARPAGALLPPQLAARAGDFPSALGLVRSSALRPQIPARDLVQQVRIDALGKNVVGQVHLAHRLALEILDVHQRHVCLDLFVLNFPRYFAPFTLRISR